MKNRAYLLRFPISSLLQSLTPASLSPVPYEEFELGGKTYYFTPGGFLYRKDPWSEEVCGFFCGFVTGEVWHYRTYSRW